jgi:GR25 family glycosyltransferase involved in LPS biosynthesis
MQDILYNYFDNVYVINLDRRPDRLINIKQQFDKINCKFELIHAVDGKTIKCNKTVGNGWNYVGVTGCAYSHKKIYLDAIKHNYKNILIVEDDNIFSDDFIDYIKTYMKQVPDDWSLLYFGGNHQFKNKALNINVEKIQHTLTTNCYAIKTSVLPELLQFLPTETYKLEYPIDVLLTNLQKKYNCYTSKPKLCWQLEDFSDIESKVQPIPFLKTINKKASVIISSFNQLKRLKFCLKSICKQDYDNYEVILADDNSTDGTVEYVTKHFPGIIISLNKKSKSNKYTLADNWNTAAEIATGERLIFTNGDNIFCTGYVSAHMDPCMQDAIIFGPNERSTQEIEQYLETDMTSAFLIKSLRVIERDLRHDDSAYTYNLNYNYWYPWGNNFSILKKDFIKAGKFPSKEFYGGEEKELCEIASVKYKVPIKSNCNTYTLHLWHPQYNNSNTKERKLYKL